jgi:hypothetical protein
MARPDKATRAAIAKRRADAIDLKLASVDWLTIARKLAADPAVNSDGIAYPQGYGVDRYRKGLEPPTEAQLINAACKDVREALKVRKTELDENVDELRRVHLERLDRLFFIAYRKAVRDGDLAAIDRAVKIMERQAKLLPLDVPVRTELSGPGGGPFEVEAATASELDRLIALAEDGPGADE